MTAALNQEQLNKTFAALANETRRAILAQLARGETHVNELAKPFNMSLPAISKHLKVLEKAGLIIQTKKAQYRPCEINAEPLREISNWTEQYRPIWEKRFDQMDKYLNQIQQEKEQ